MPTSLADLAAAEREPALRRLAELVAVETPSLDLAASARIGGMLADAYADLGAEVAVHATETGTHLVADLPGAGAPLLLVGHSDTVWPVGTIDGAVPYVVDGDRIAGPGVFDMKSGLVVIEAALRITGRLGDRRAVRIVITGDEEVGSPGSRPIVEAACAGVGGAIGFESPHPDGALKVGRRGSTRLRLDVTGREAHAALDPERGISAVDELVDQLLALRSIVDRERAAGHEVLANVGTIAGGGRANVIAGTASAELGLRFVDLPTERRLLAELTALPPIRAGAEVAATVLSNRPAWLAGDADAALLATIAAASADAGLESGAAITGRPAAGAGDTNLVAAIGVPSVDGFGPIGAGAHAAHEHLLVPSLLERIAMLAAVLRAGD